VKNITVTVPDDVYLHARIRAAEEGRSVSALVTEYLEGLAGQGAEFARLLALQQEVQSSVTRFRGGDRLDRDGVHERAVR
jgi:plasmid stability protein